MRDAALGLLLPPLPLERNGLGEFSAEVALGSFYEGPAGFVHGGATALVFDEVFGRAVIAFLGRGAMTAHLAIDYRRPWPLEAPAWITACVVRTGERKLDVTGEARGGDGTLYAEARGLWVVPRPR